MKTYQLVNNKDGSRSDFFVGFGPLEIAMELDKASDKNPEILEHYVLLIAEVSKVGEVQFCRDPMVQVKTFLSKYIV